MKVELTNKIVKYLVLSIIVFGLTAGNSFSQSTLTGGIRGNVTDQQSASLPNATINLWC